MKTVVYVNFTLDIDVTNFTSCLRPKKKNMCDSSFPTDPLILVPTQKFLWLISRSKLKNLYFGENFIKIGGQFRKLFKVKHSNYQYFF